MREDEILIEFEELPKRLQHALEVEVEWHSVLVYEIEKGIYGFYIMDEYMPSGSNLAGLIRSEYSHGNDGFIQESIQKIIDTKFKKIRCKYFPKGCLSTESLQVSIVRVCEFRDEFNFSIEIHSSDYGFLDGIESKSAPAYAYVLDKEELEIGLLNITGSCPKKVSDVKEFRPPHKFGYSTSLKVTPLMKHRKNLIKWANSLRNEETNWKWTQYVWRMGHKYTR
jgi:hypothetical protein